MYKYFLYSLILDNDAQLVNMMDKKNNISTIYIKIHIIHKLTKYRKCNIIEDGKLEI